MKDPATMHESIAALVHYVRASVESKPGEIDYLAAGDESSPGEVDYVMTGDASSSGRVDYMVASEESRLGEVDCVAASVETRVGDLASRRPSERPTESTRFSNRKPSQQVAWMEAQSAEIRPTISLGLWRSIYLPHISTAS